MYYLFKAQPDAKLKENEKKLPKAGKLVLLLFFLFHVAFLGFNFWYFYYNVVPESEAGSDNESIVSSIVEAIGAE